MKNLILALSIFSISSFAAAEQSITLKFNGIKLASQENSATQIDLSKELQKQSPGTSMVGQRVKSIIVTGDSSSLGATVMLLVSGRAIDSQTVQSVNSTATLSSNIGLTPGQWALAVRGQMTVQQVVVTLDAQGTTSDDVSFDRGTKVLKALPVEIPGYFMPEQVLYYVGDQNTVSKVYVRNLYADNSVEIIYNNNPYIVRDMRRLAMVAGCTLTSDVCVGDPIVVSTADGRSLNATIVGIQTEDYFVVNIDGKSLIGNWPRGSIRFK